MPAYRSRSAPRLALHLLLGACFFTGAIAAATAQQRRIPFDSIEQRVAACLACHGEQGRSTREGYFPRIAGKPAGYLFNQLVNFRDGRRQQYPLMIYMVQHLSDQYLQEIAQFFANQHPPYPPPPAPEAPPPVLERGRTLALQGDASRRIPACVACHGKTLSGVAPSIPGLLGLPRDYINAQFGAWRAGSRRAAEPDCMAELAKRLTPEEISAASAWLAVQPVAAEATPAPAQSIGTRLPLECGSFPQQEGGR